MKKILLWPFEKLAEKLQNFVENIKNELNYEYDLQREELKNKTKTLCWQNKRELTLKEKRAIFYGSLVNENLNNDFAQFLSAK